ncbi:MAG: sulfotransferase family protein [Methylococcales bacterium]
MLPNFLVIGTYRAGTTWLYEVLRQHPEVFLPAEKELMFFSHHYTRGIAWYEQFYSDCMGQKRVGEICPTYLASEEAPERIARHCPMARLVAILRKPSEQVMSRYRLKLTRGLTSRSFDEEMAQDAYLLDAVLYHRHLMRYLALFGPDRLSVLFYDDLVRDPLAFLKDFYRVLDLAPFYPPAAQLRQNASRVPRSLTVESLSSGLARFLRRNGLLNVKIFLNRLGLADHIKRLNTQPSYANIVPAVVLRRVAELTADDRKSLGLWT